MPPILPFSGDLPCIDLALGQYMHDGAIVQGMYYVKSSFVWSVCIQKRRKRQGRRLRNRSQHVLNGNMWKFGEVDSTAICAVCGNALPIEFGSSYERDQNRFAMICKGCTRGLSSEQMNEKRASATGKQQISDAVPKASMRNVWAESARRIGESSIEDFSVAILQTACVIDVMGSDRDTGEGGGVLETVRSVRGQGMPYHGVWGHVQNVC